MSKIKLRWAHLRWAHLLWAHLRWANLRLTVYGILVIGGFWIAVLGPAIGNPRPLPSEYQARTPLPQKGIISEDPSRSSKSASDPIPLQKPRAPKPEPVRENCRLCHNGIEEISASHPLSLGCTVCHGGTADAQDKDRAHATLIHDPAAS